MKNKILMFSTSVLVISLIVNSLIYYCNSLGFGERKCAQYKPSRIDITFSHRNQCLQSVKASQNETTNEWNMNTLEEIETRGYKVSTHTILSKDGYYSTLYRISGGKRSPSNPGKRSILVFHGFAAAAQSWIIQPGSRNLAFTLADASYDVWLANIRGTTASKNHTHLNADTDSAYWDFGIEQVSTLDLPLMVSLILQETGTDKIYYVCHSAGCEIQLAGLVDVPELNDKIEASFYLAPGGFVGSGYNPIFNLLRLIGTPLQQLLLKISGGKMSGEPSALLKFLGLSADNICKWSFTRCGICDNFLFALYGADPEQMDYNNFPNIIKKLQDNGPWRIFFHGVQMVKACEFLRYDFGERRNLLEYGSANPPVYNLSSMTVPTYIFYGEGDNFLTPWDMARMKAAIPKQFVKGFYQVDWPKFNHIDFLIAKDAMFWYITRFGILWMKLNRNGSYKIFSGLTGIPFLKVSVIVYDLV
ncbi:unnamed protein product [Orchesella dallaii]|uniref:Partial AB-hydrolase lipase domain-containing protein n=1 Tax=Orchesella dallaii TaxID=48710 RepID=A0ABP1RN12_9HEXA